MPLFDGDLSSIASNFSSDLKDNVSTSQGVLDQILKAAGGSHLNSGITSSIWGLDNMGGGAVLYPNTDHYGMIFFTRPRLKLSYDNVTRDRFMANLATTDLTSMAAMIRHYLDPVAGALGNCSNLVDQQQAFIPLLSNLCMSATGWPDPNIGVYTSNPGLMGEQWGMIDSHPYTYQAWQLSCNFKNVNGNPIYYLIKYWIRYACLVYLGVMDPHLDALLDFEIDYQTRVWRIILDPTRTLVRGISSCAAAFPMTLPEGERYNFNKDHPINAGFDEMNITFQCFGAWYDDPILVREFNQTVAIFHPGMSDLNRDSQMQLVSPLQRALYNRQSYPHIDETTMKLEWYIDNENALGSISSLSSMLNSTANQNFVTPAATQPQSTTVSNSPLPPAQASGSSNNSINIVPPTLGLPVDPGLSNIGDLIVVS